MRIMGLDLGDRRIGVSLSDPEGLIAQSLTVIHRVSRNRDVQTIGELVAEHEVERIVIGLPRRMDGTLGPEAKKAEEMAREIERRLSVPTILWDERLTTVAAQKAMIEAGVRREKRREKIDAVAAALLLQNYLDYLRAGSHPSDSESRE